MASALVEAAEGVLQELDGVLLVPVVLPVIHLGCDGEDGGTGVLQNRKKNPPSY